MLCPLILNPALLKTLNGFSSPKMHLNSSQQYPPCSALFSHIPHQCSLQPSLSSSKALCPLPFALSTNTTILSPSASEPSLSWTPQVELSLLLLLRSQKKWMHSLKLGPPQDTELQKELPLARSGAS